MHRGNGLGIAIRIHPMSQEILRLDYSAEGTG
jgi:hypothetical protein